LKVATGNRRTAGAFEKAKRKLPDDLKKAFAKRTHLQAP
jgi:hypothetical protein